MTKLLFVLAILAGIAQAQSYPSVIQLSPASATYPCPVGLAAKNGTSIICPTQPGAITVDFGDSKGYVPLGQTGPKGDPGTAATVAVGATTVGSTASVTNSGTPSAAVFNFVVPQGPAGPPGQSWTSCTNVTLTPSGIGVYTLTIIPANCK